MNNNKISKKWLLGLVAPALILAPIAVVASCSSSTTESTTKKATTAKSEIAIKTLVPEIQENTTSEVFKAGFDGANDNQKQKLVFDNVSKLLEGDHEVKQADQIISPKLMEVQDDQTKLTLSFKLAVNTWYGSDGKLGTSESSEFSISITGFAAAADEVNPKGEPTVAITEVNVQTLDQTFIDVEASKFKDEITEEMVRQLVAQKMSNLFTGDHNVKSETDIQSATLHDGDDETELKLKVKLKAKTWYDSNKNLGETESGEFEIKLTGFKAPDSSTGPGGLIK